MTCSGKECFTSFALADRVASLSNNRHCGYRMRAYKCHECGAFHVGSSIGKVRRAERSRFIVREELA